MIPGIEPLYQTISDSINEAISEDWITAAMEAVFYDGSISYYGEYISAGDCRAISFETAEESQAAFRELRNKFIEDRKKPFGRALFTLHADGAFHMKLGYDNCDDNGKTLYDGDKYIRQHRERHARLISGRSALGIGPDEPC
jgi:hypothetical protein